ncbi:hypothetical protein D9M69_439050 [compost metagenome]
MPGIAAPGLDGFDQGGERKAGRQRDFGTLLVDRGSPPAASSTSDCTNPIIRRCRIAAAQYKQAASAITGCGSAFHIAGIDSGFLAGIECSFGGVTGGQRRRQTCDVTFNAGQNIFQGIAASADVIGASRASQVLAQYGITKGHEVRAVGRPVAGHGVGQ